MSILSRKYLRFGIVGAGLLALGLAGCTVPADLPPRSTDGAGTTPDLLPIRQIIAQYNQPRRGDQAAGDLQARASALQARAAALRGPVIPERERRRLLGANARLR